MIASTAVNSKSTSPFINCTGLYLDTKDTATNVYSHIVSFTVAEWEKDIIACFDRLSSYDKLCEVA